MRMIRRMVRFVGDDDKGHDDDKDDEDDDDDDKDEDGEVGDENLLKSSEIFTSF